MMIRLELEAETIAVRMVDVPAGVRLQLIGLLLQAEGLARECAPVLEGRQAHAIQASPTVRISAAWTILWQR